ncbi:hypothetical protein KKD88_03830 [Patescibacteria group bacterium]|nr:hypothetical protein [Patescibacteria group bacterium]
MEDNQLIHVWCDWESTGIWIRRDSHFGYAEYEDFGLPADLVGRFKYWERWHSDTYPEQSNEQNKMDRDLYDAYGLSLAIDLKRFVEDKHRVFYGHPTYPNCAEIVLARRERVEQEEGRWVPISVPYKK